MKAAQKSWLKEEIETPLHKIRKVGWNITQSAQAQLNKEQACEKLTALKETTPNSAQPALEAAINWLGHGGGNTPNLTDPFEQAIWGTALLLNSKLEQPHPEKHLIESSRLTRERGVMGALLLGTLNKDTKIGWGKSGSWFYHNPVEHRINIDPGHSLLFGLQNTRGILLHEIGHSEITGPRSPKIIALQAEISSLVKNRTVPPEDRQKAANLARELQYRENFWQLAEDTAVNTYAEIQGSNFTNHIPTALMRTYAVMGAEVKKESDPLEELVKKLTSADPGDKEIQRGLNTVSNAYPIQRGWMDTDSAEDWKITDSDPELLKLTAELCDQNNPGALANLQPTLVAKRYEAFLEHRKAAITKECATARNAQIDQLFDQVFLPRIEKLPPVPPPPDFTLDPPQGENQPKEGPTDPNEETLETAQTRIERSDKETQEEKKAAAKTREASRTAGIQSASNSKSPLEDLPECKNYEEFLQNCSEQIAQMTGVLKSIHIKQQTPAPKTPGILPKRSLREFDRGRYIAAMQKSQAGEALSPEDYKTFQNPTTQATPAITHLGFYLDGSGSVFGKPAKKILLTVLIMHEAAKQVPNLTITAVYSGAEATYPIITTGVLPEKSKELIAGILQTGFASGDNEISVKGLGNFTQHLANAQPKTGKVGTTHMLFLTDGGTGRIPQEIAAIETLLNDNPEMTFDSILLKGGILSKDWENASRRIKPNRPRQTPKLEEVSSNEEICPKIASLLTGRIKEFKSFAPKESKVIRGKLQHSAKKLADFPELP